MDDTGEFAVYKRTTYDPHDPRVAASVEVPRREPHGLVVVPPAATVAAVTQASKFKFRRSRFTSESLAEYRSRKCVTWSELNYFRKYGNFYRKRLIGWQAMTRDHDKDKNRNLLFGQALHCLLLDGPRGMGERYVVGGPKRPNGTAWGRNTIAFRKWVADFSDVHGREVLTWGEWDLCRKLVRVLRADPNVQKLLSRGVREGILRAPYCRVPSQVRLDFFNPQYGIVELKTTGRLTNLWFCLGDMTHTLARDYFGQAAFNQAVLLRAMAQTESDLDWLEGNEPGDLTPGRIDY
jgi:hypothetical protein